MNSSRSPVIVAVFCGVALWASSTSAQGRNAIPAPDVEEKPAKATPFSKLLQKQPDAETLARRREFEKGLRPLLMTELNFARNVCKPDARQLALLKEVAEARLKKSVVELDMRLQSVNGNEVTETPRQSTRTAIRGAILQAVKESLNPQQHAALEARLEQRAAHQREAVILMAVARLDDRLVLSAQQRSRLITSLSADWKPTEHWLAGYRSDGAFVPFVPDAIVMPVLDSQQKAVWKNIEKSSEPSANNDLNAEELELLQVEFPARFGGGGGF